MKPIMMLSIDQLGVTGSDRFPVLSDHLKFVFFVAFSFFFLFEAADYPPGSSSGPDHVLVCY